MVWDFVKRFRKIKVYNVDTFVVVKTPGDYIEKLQ